MIEDKNRHGRKIGSQRVRRIVPSEPSDMRTRSFGMKDPLINFLRERILVDHDELTYFLR